MAQYILENTALCGAAECGVMECGVYGLYTQEITPDNPDPSYEDCQFKIIIGTKQYPGISGLTWSHSLGSDNVSQCSFKIYNDEPVLFEKVTISVAGQPIWVGFVSSYTSGYAGGTIDEGNFTIEYSIDAVSRENWLSRYYVNETFSKKSAKHMIRSMLSEYAPSCISFGEMITGKVYDVDVRFENEQLSSVISRLSDASDAYYYIDPYSRFKFLKKYSIKAPINLDYETTLKWKLLARNYPKNNYHNTSTSQDISNVYTRVKIKGVRFLPQIATFVNVDEYIEEQSRVKSDHLYKNSFLITANQKDISVPSQIYDVNRIECIYCQLLPNLSDPTGDMKKNLIEAYYHNPVGLTYSSSGISRNYASDFLCNQMQYQYIFGQDSRRVVDPETGEKRKVTYSDIDKNSDIFWNNRGIWKPTNYDSRLAWEALDAYTGKEKYSDYVTIMDQLQLVPAFTWQISYGGNSVSFVAPYELGNEQEFQYYLFSGTIIYVSSEPYTYTIDSPKASKYGALDGSGSAEIEHTVEDSGINCSSLAKEYGEALLKANSEPSQSVSYSRYLFGTDILNCYFRPGMYQSLRLHNRDFNLGIESVSYSIVSFQPLVIKVDLQLSTKTKNLEEILARLLRY